MCSRINSTKLERWYGKEWIENTVNSMKGWYGNPIPVAGNRGNVTVDADGYFAGKLNCGDFSSYHDVYDDFLGRLWKGIKRLSRRQVSTMQIGGLASLSEYLTAMRNNRSVAHINKTTIAGATGGSVSTWTFTGTPIAGNASSSSAPGGQAYNLTDNGAIKIPTPDTGEKMFVAGGFFIKTNATVEQPILLYDRIFGVAKTMSSAATEAVTGVPTRYQSTNNLDADSAVGNFLTVEVASTLSATAHNWTVCTYTNQDGNAATLPSLTGLSAPSTGRLDLPVQSWFAPLAAGDRGIRTLTQMQCSSAALTGSINFIIGHPIAWIPFVGIYSIIFDGLLGGFQLTRIFNNACLSLILTAGQNTSTVNTGTINIITR